ncbi:MAG TPA: glycoside hydrolase family 99-like domain-containing protein [Bacteroidia bacterium]|nr:glycoside hydrolase family 99-like domain-containing protein [Bacteroidia bacterium]
MSKLRPIAIYLPQFHPFAENDEWWGKGFTEWTNVTKTVPRFKGHYQPHLPADMGFYDLRVHQALISQAELAKQYGIYGFCFYHYWFNGKRLLERPLEDMLAKGTPDFPFCLCWANENWTRRWDGLEQEVLMKQDYSEEDDRRHINFLARYFRDPRYIRVDGKPVFIVYRPKLFPDIRRTAETWREECRKNGVGEIYLMYMQSFSDRRDPAELGFDAAVEFQPDFSFLPQPVRPQRSLWSRLAGAKATGDNIFLYKDVVREMLRKPAVAFKRYPGIFPSWDNSPRRSTGATIIHDSTPGEYGKWLRHIIAGFKPYSVDENFIFINAWNEWAEGNHLEPCRKWGRAYLEETQKALTA